MTILYLKAAIQKDIVGEAFLTHHRLPLCIGLPVTTGRSPTRGLLLRNYNNSVLLLRTLASYTAESLYQPSNVRQELRALATHHQNESLYFRDESFPDF